MLVLCEIAEIYSYQGDENEITSGQEEATPHLHREGLSCAVEVPSTRGSREGEPPPQLTDLLNKKNK